MLMPSWWLLLFCMFISPSCIMFVFYNVVERPSCSFFTSEQMRRLSALVGALEPCNLMLAGSVLVYIRTACAALVFYMRPAWYAHNGDERRTHAGHQRLLTT